MSEPIRLLIHGANGRMGQALLRLCAVRGDFRVVAAVSARTPAQRVIDGVPFLAAREMNGAAPFDLAIDFSQPAGFDAVLALCVARRAGFLSGTTGLSEDQRAALATAAESVPVLWSANFSLGVALMEELVERAGAVLEGWDCDIVESHHAHKKDAPSGTALALGAAATRAGASPRYASLRAGDIIGEHMVQFATAGERIELVHRAGNRDIFASGALHAAARLHARAPGLYRLRDVLD